MRDGFMKVVAKDRDIDAPMEIGFLCECGGAIRFHGEQITLGQPLEVGHCLCCYKLHEICLSRVFNDLSKRYLCAHKVEIIMEKE